MMEEAAQLDAAIRALLRTLSLDERNAPKLPNGERLGLLDMELLTLIAEQPGIPAKALIDQLGVKPTTMQSAIGRLERRKLVSRDTKALKGRSVALHLTEPGKSVTDEILSHNLRNCTFLLSALPAKEKPLFLSNMAKLAGAVARPTNTE